MLKDQHELNILQFYYETMLANNQNDNKVEFDRGMLFGVRIALINMGYSNDILNDIKNVWNVLEILKNN